MININKLLTSCAFFFKKAQDGNLKDTETLIRESLLIDWDTIIAKQFQGFTEFLKESSLF